MDLTPNELAPFACHMFRRTKLVRLHRIARMHAPFAAEFHLTTGVQMKREEQEQLFRYTSGHWLYNDSQQRAERYVKFDVAEIQRVACASVGAKQCIEFVKLAEGSYNKIFLLKFENTSQVIVRIPSPLAGPPHLNTASEVATLEFVRTELGIPVPRVLAWSSKADSNPVGAEYIIMECVPGVSLYSRWNQLAGGAQVNPLLHGLFAIESKFSHRRFSQIGSLYFKEDVSAELQRRPLLLNQEGDEAYYQATERYRIGPLVDRQWWRGERASMASDRGPWPDLSSYLIAAARCQQAWLNHHANPGTPYCRPNQRDTLSDHAAILDIYASAAPLIVPPSLMCQSTLWHPDLSLSNIMVSPTGPAEIQGLIDWQGAWTAPYCMQATFPLGLAYDGEIIQVPEGPGRPVFPDDLDQRSPEDQAEIRLHHRFAMRHKAYEYIMAKDANRVAACSISHLQELCMLPYHVLRSWSDGLVVVRQQLLQLAQKWGDIAPSGTSCPIQFSPEAEEAHQQEFANFQRYQESIEAVHKLVGAEGDGWVSNEHFDQAKKRSRKVEVEWNNEARGGPYPFKDGMYSFFLS